MVSSLIETLELLNFGYMTTSAIYFESRDKFCCDVMDRNNDVITLSQNTLKF